MCVCVYIYITEIDISISVSEKLWQKCNTVLIREWSFVVRRVGFVSLRVCEWEREFILRIAVNKDVLLFQLEMWFNLYSIQELIHAGMAIIYVANFTMERRTDGKIWSTPHWLSGTGELPCLSGLLRAGVLLFLIILRCSFLRACFGGLSQWGHMSPWHGEWKGPQPNCWNFHFPQLLLSDKIHDVQLSLNYR